MQLRVYVKGQLVLSDFKGRIFLTEFLKNNQVPNFMTIPPVEAELDHANG